MPNPYKILVCLLLLLLPACGANTEVFSINGNWSPAEIAAARDAFDEWCDMSGGEYCATLGGENAGSSFTLSNTTVEESGLFGRYSFRYHKLTIFLVPGHTDWLNHVRLITMHELGHHFRGHGHLPQGNVMQPCGVGSNHLTEADMIGQYARSMDTCKEAEDAEDKDAFEEDAFTIVSSGS